MRLYTKNRESHDIPTERLRLILFLLDLLGLTSVCGGLRLSVSVSVSDTRAAVSNRLLLGGVISPGVSSLSGGAVGSLLYLIRKKYTQ